MVSPGKIKLNQEERFKGAFQECEVFFSGAEEVTLDLWDWGWGLQETKTGVWLRNTKTQLLLVYRLQACQQSARPRCPHL